MECAHLRPGGSFGFARSALWDPMFFPQYQFRRRSALLLVQGGSASACGLPPSALMPLVPGAALTNAMREIMAGDLDLDSTARRRPFWWPRPSHFKCQCCRW